ncbi:MAG: hypothetical protein IPK75_20065 [Acidobacteria bacterium]|nr:hypothetical protein [Acidobacteriota bacterium]
MNAEADDAYCTAYFTALPMEDHPVRLRNVRIEGDFDSIRSPAMTSTG